MSVNFFLDKALGLSISKERVRNLFRLISLNLAQVFVHRLNRKGFLGGGVCQRDCQHKISRKSYRSAAGTRVPTITSYLNT